MNRRDALKWIGTAAAVGAAGPRLGVLERLLHAQGGIDWAARVAALPQPAADEVVIAAVGDMMISDPVSNRGLPEVDALYRVLRDADVAFGNSEQPVADTGALRGGFTQTADPPILDDWRTSGLTMLSLANNQSLDLGVAGMLDWIEESESRGFTVAGAGRTLDEATSPGVTTVNGQRVGLLAFLCASNANAEFRAGANTAGIGLIAGSRVSVPGSPFPLTLPNAADMQTMADAVRRARADVDTLMVSFHMHWGVDVPPGERFARPDVPPRTLVPAALDDPDNHVAEGRRIICRAAVDAGADVVIGHGPHVLNGVEVYQGKPILYSLSHFFMQLLRDGQAVPRMRMSPTMARFAETSYYLEEHRWAAVARMFVRRGTVTRVQLLPVYMDVQRDGYPLFPPDAEAATINGAITELSRPFDTVLRTDGWYTEVVL
jgi:poly-gamma-glutamate capsule biosynthesis protein CapA/YwtB (metallophosphatase superfamily)